MNELGLRPDRSSSYAAVAVAAVVAAVVAAILVWATARPSPPPVSAAHSVDPRPASVERQIAARRLARIVPPADFVTTPPTVAIDGFVPTRRLSPPWGAVNAALFDADDVRIRLAHVVPVPRDAVCTDDTGRRLACGLQARAALHNALAGKTVRCREAFARDGRIDAAIVAECDADGEDLAERLVRAGYAFPYSGAPRRLAEAEAEARAARRGVWVGPWTAPSSDPSVEEARLYPFGSLRPLPPSDTPRPAN